MPDPLDRARAYLADAQQVPTGMSLTYAVLAAASALIAIAEQLRKARP